MKKCSKGFTSNDIQSPFNVPLNQDTLSTVRKNPLLPDPECSPTSHDDNPRLQGNHRVPLTNPSPLGKQHVKDGSPLITLTYPSPVGKRLMGISSNARNDIYMKTLLNSPYHQTYSLPSAAPSGSIATYNTPVHTDQDQIENSKLLTARTPQGTKLPHSGTRKFVTPKNTVVNPFDNGIDDLHLPTYMSPGFFTVSTPASEKMFSWAIEHIAELNPADIDDMPVHQVHSIMPDKETEARAQFAIDQFFASNQIVPSPWSDPKKEKWKYILPESLGSGGKYLDEMMADLQGSIEKSLPTKEGMNDACCQTVLSLPVNVDIQKVLGNYMTQDSGTGDDGNQQDVLSTSSLRRKLFFHGDTSSVAPSPVKCVSHGIQPDPGSPKSSKQTPSKWEYATPLKNILAFSSSPIKGIGSSPQYRCSSNPEFLESPELSPIVTGNCPNSCRKSRSSDLFEVHQEGFDSPKGDYRGLVCGGMSDTLSPIPFENISNVDQHKENSDGSPGFSHPNLDGSPGISCSNFNGSPGISHPHFDGSPGFSRPNFIGSPGFSPIHPSNTPIQKILRSQEESYIQGNTCESEDEDSLTPISSNSRLTTTSLTPVIELAHTSNPRQTTTPVTPVVELSHIQRANKQHISSAKSKSHSCTDLQQSQMDVETAPNPCDHMLTSSLCNTVDLSDSADYINDTQLHTSSSNQDTGYQTASLQSTNQELGSLHTNLTNQFGSLPFNLTNQDMVFQNGSYLHTSQEKPPVFNLTHQFSLVANQLDSGDEHFETNLAKPIITQNVQAFRKQRLFLSDQFDQNNTTKERVVSRLNFDDSAFPDNADDTSTDFMEVDLKRDVDNKDEVMFHAHHALDMANTQENKKLCRNLMVGDPGPQKLNRQLIHGDFVKDKPGLGDLAKDKLGQGDLAKDKQPSDSELAYSILKHTEDVAWYDLFMAGRTTNTEVLCRGLHGN